MTLLAKSPRLTLAPLLRASGAGAALGSLILIMMGASVAFYQERLHSEILLQQVMTQAHVLAASVATPLYFGDPKAVQEYVNALGANADLTAAAVYDGGGHRVAALVLGAQGVPNAVRVQEPFVADNQVVATLDVMQSGTKVGAVYLRVLADRWDRRLVRYSGTILLLTMALLVLSALGGALRRLGQANKQLQLEMAERSKAEEALRQSQKMEAVGQLAGGVAHDFNNLLAIIKSSVQLTQRRLTLPERANVQRFLDAAMDGVNRATSVTQRILAFSRRQTLTQQPCDLNAMVENMTELIRHATGEQLRVETRLAATWPALCDLNQMETVILNLANNARDAMTEGGVLTIETADERRASTTEGLAAGDYVRLTVRDTGSGMSAEVRERAFDPFFTTKAHGKGTGLGLSMTLGYVTQSGGSVSIDSAPGKGTAVTILMPRAAATSGSE